ncbi:CUE domain-containing protein [Schizosaccharomyces octosporus yFS286]|uniref:CUE domain-containing protein n=1 Tax=Schizosaccharomyces octosporus (strain yFS286) TaxID=483514 RepID=S9R859_SCHOY|nr:CUE domain-containing protein [Schizosaccharomyces octosporus yFS286]EPX74415.1 CUE domain-containing protein [Schizosaccharomyces octosporus yFS286]
MNSEASAPRLPTRPPHRHEQAKATLKEAFPDTDDAIIRAVLAASGFHIEPAFNALLGLNDPSVADELEQLHLSSAHPQTLSRESAQKQSEEDELCARRLAKRYQKYPASNRDRNSNRKPMTDRRAMPRSENRMYSYDKDNEDYSFLENDFPVLKDNFVRGFQSIKQRSMAWMDKVASKLEGSDEYEDDINEPPVYNKPFQNSASTATDLESAYEDIPPPTPARRSVRPDSKISLPPYEADPHMLNEKDFERLQLESTSSPVMGRSSLASTRKSVESSSSAFAGGQSLILDSNGAIESSNSAFALDDSDLESTYEEETGKKNSTASAKKERDENSRRKENTRDLESVSEEQYGPAPKIEQDSVKKDEKKGMTKNLDADETEAKSKDALTTSEKTEDNKEEKQPTTKDINENANTTTSAETENVEHEKKEDTSNSNEQPKSKNHTEEKAASSEKKH